MADEMPPDLKNKVQKMIDAGETEENIASVIKWHKAAFPAKTPDTYTGPTTAAGGFWNSIKSGEALGAGIKGLEGAFKGGVLDLPATIASAGKNMYNPLSSATLPFKMAHDLIYGPDGTTPKDSLDNLKKIGSDTLDTVTHAGSKPFEFGEMTGHAAIQPAVAEGLTRVPWGTVAEGSVAPTGRAFESIGGVIKRKQPVTGLFAPFIAPRTFRNLESAFGSGLEKLGQSMGRYGGNPIEYGKVGEYWGGGSPNVRSYTAADPTASWDIPDETIGGTVWEPGSPNMKYTPPDPPTEWGFVDDTQGGTTWGDGSPNVRTSTAPDPSPLDSLLNKPVGSTNPSEPSNFWEPGSPNVRTSVAPDPPIRPVPSHEPSPFWEEGSPNARSSVAPNPPPPPPNEPSPYWEQGSPNARVTTQPDPPAGRWVDDTQGGMYWEEGSPNVKYTPPPETPHTWNPVDDTEGGKLWGGGSPNARVATAPDPPIRPMASHEPTPNTGTGSAFEKAMQAKSAEAKAATKTKTPKPKGPQAIFDRSRPGIVGGSLDGGKTWKWSTDDGLTWSAVEPKTTKK